MDEDKVISERERALQERITRLEKKLEGCQSQRDIIDDQRQQLEERAIKMESVLLKTTKELSNARKQLREKDMSSSHYAEKLESITRQKEEYKSLLFEEREKIKYSTERLETILSRVEAEMASRKEFQGFLNEMLVSVKEELHTQLRIVFNKLTRLENTLHESPQEITHPSCQARPSFKKAPYSLDPECKPPDPKTSLKKCVGSPNASPLSFQSVASSSLAYEPFRQKITNSPCRFPCADTTLFTSSSLADHDKSAAEENHNGLHFKPIIPLPYKIDVKTGEEDEQVLFSYRAKLYRFFEEDKQWKERGVGDIKLLKNRQSGKMRVLMRRDQVPKICANHEITTDMELQPNAGSERSWVWSTLADFSEQECKAERLAVRFQSVDTAKQFKEKFEECQEMLKNATDNSNRPYSLASDSSSSGGRSTFSSSEPLLGDEKTVFTTSNSNKPPSNASGPLSSLKLGSPSTGLGDTKTAPSLGASNQSFSVQPGSPSSGGGLKFGSLGTNRGDKKTVFTLHSSNQPFSLPAGSPSFREGFKFGSLGTSLGNTKTVPTLGASNQPFSVASGPPSFAEGFKLGSLRTSLGNTKTAPTLGDSNQPLFVLTCPQSFGTGLNSGFLGTSLGNAKTVPTLGASNQPLLVTSGPPSSGTGFSLGSPRTSLGVKKTAPTLDASNQPLLIAPGPPKSGTGFNSGSLGTSVSVTKTVPTLGVSNQPFSVASSSPSSPKPMLPPTVASLSSSKHPSHREDCKPYLDPALKSRKPLIVSDIKESLKINSTFFPGLSASNSPEKRVEHSEEFVTLPAWPGRPRHDSSTSYTKDLKSEQVIPLPKRVDVQTGEEDKEVMFSSRAKLYRYDKDVSAWKERGIGILKILYNSEKGRSRILMRREAIHKICANHFITNNMKLTEKKGTTNAWIWNTFADYSEEIEKQEQLAVRFKTQDEFLLFKKKFEYCQNLPKKDTSNVHKTAQSTNEKTSDLMGKFAAKPGSWSCSMCLISNEERTSVCIACGAAKLSGGNAAVSRPQASKSGFRFSSGATPSSSPLLGLQGKHSSEGPSLVTNVNAGTTFAVVNSGLGTSDGSSISSSFSFSVGKDANKIIYTSSTGSQVEFGKSGVQTLNTASSSLPISFSFRESGTRLEKTSLSGSPFVFGTSSAGTTHNKASESEEGAVPIQLFGVSSTLPAGTKPPMAQPFLLAPFGVPADTDKSNSPTFTFGSSSMAAASLPSPSLPSFSTTEKAAFENTLLSTKTSVFGGTPQLADPGVPFASFNTGKSPSFDPDLSASDTKSDPQLGEKNEGVSQVPLNVLEHALRGQTYPPSSFSTPTTNPGISEHKLFWQQPTGTFQFGQLQSRPPLGGANLWHRETRPPSDPAKSQPKGTPQTPEMFSQPFTLSPHSQMQGAFTLSSRPDMDFSSSELLRRLAAAKEQQELVTPDSLARGYDFTPYVVDEPGEEFSLQGTTVPTSFVAEEYDHNHDDNVKYLDETEDSDDETRSCSATDDEEDELDKSPSRMPTIQPSQVQVQFQSGEGNVVTIPVKPVPIHSAPSENVGPATLPSHMTGRRFLTAKSPLKATKKQDEDCVLVYEVRAPMGDREKASRLCLPVNFFNYTKYAPCSGCYGCGISKEPMISKNENEAKATEPRSKNGDLRPKLSIPTSHVFGESSGVGQLTFSSLKPKEGDALSTTQKIESFKPFQGAGKQLFAETSEDVEGRDDDKLHFEPIIALPDEIQVVTGEEGLDVLFCERGKLYRFDSDSGQWKERGLGEMKLLQHPKSGQGRVLMRREQIKKLCANHYISAGMELKRNVGSDRSWVWYTPADYAEGEAKPERLAIRFKSEEIAGKFKEVFDDLKETLPIETSPAKEAAVNEQGTGCALYKQFLSRFAPAPGSWICEVCDVDNDAEHLQCIACNFGKTAREPQGTMSKAKEENLNSLEPVSNAAVLQSEAANTAQDVIKEPSQASFIFQSPGGSGLASPKLFTIGRGDPNEENEDEIYLSPSKTSSPSKQGSILLQKPATIPETSNLPSSLPFGGTTPVKFTFSLTVSPGSPSRKPKSPSSPATPSSPESPGRGEDDGPYFEPLIPLPDKVECRTGEEGQEVLFCERCKLFRYDGDASQWKERGVGDIKILCDSKSNKNRILMRREHVLKLCANHVISTDMMLQPFPNSDKAWLWTTLADFSEEEATAETLAARFRTSEVATKFKETFDKAAKLLVSKQEKGLSSSKQESEPPDSRTSEEPGEDIMIFFEKGVTADQKEKANRLQSPSNFFGYENSSPEISSDMSETVARQSDQPKSDPTPKESSTSTSNKTGFLFGSASVSSLTFQSIVASSLDSSPFEQKIQGGFSGAGSQLFASKNADEDDETGDDNHEGPHFEPIIPLPEKIDIKTGEEGDEVIFSHRAKLYRFVAEDKQWKERGVGDIKLLKNRQSGKMRILMRRDQVLKICANHQITAEMKLQPNAGSDRSWVWSTMADFSEGECRAERLAVRFKSEETAKQYKEKFEECLEILKNPTPVKPHIEPKTIDAKEDLVSKFKPAEGSWECTVCMVNNDSDKVECAACGSIKPGAEPNQGQKKEVKSSFLFGSGASSSGGSFTFGFGVSSQEGDTKPVFTFGSSNQTSGPISGFSFTFGSSKQGGPGSEQQTEDSNSSLALSIEQKSDEEVDDFEDDHKHQEISINQTSAKLTKEEGKNEDAGKDIMVKFKPAEGSWECEICMLNNNGDKVECAACGSVKPETEAIKEQRQDSKSPFPFGFDASSSGGVLSFGSSGTAQGDPKPVFTFGSQNQTSIPSSEVPFRFGSLGQGGNFGELQTNKDPKASSLIDPASNKGTDENKDDLKQTIKEGVDVKEARVDKSSTEENTSSLESDKDSAPALQDTKETLPNKEQKFLFGSPNVSSLSFQSIANSSLTKSPFGQKPKSGNSASGFPGSGTKLFTSPSSADHDESTTEEDHEGPHFEPIIPLPEKIDVKTGEEDEEVMFSQRAKLYRFVGEDKQWKERGVGDIKLLKNRQSGKLRVLMRRDQVLKVCANHQITAEMKLQPNAGSDRSWVWSTMADFSEGECRAEQLAVRFKSVETAKQFKEKFEECQKMLKNPTAVKPQVKPKNIDGKEDLVSKFKPAEGSWECTICMVINDSDKVECTACRSTKPGAEPSQGQKKEAKSFLFGSGASSSGGGFTFGFGVSSQESDTKPVFTFGSSNQTSSPSSGFSFTFGSSKQGEPGSEQQTEDSKSSLSLSNKQKPGEEADDSKDDHKRQEISKNQTTANLTKEEGKNEHAGKDIMTKFKPAEGSWECEICMVNNDSSKVECAACGIVKPAIEAIKEERQDSKSLFPSGFSASSSGRVFSFGFSGTAQVDPTKETLPNKEQKFVFGSPNVSSLSFQSIVNSSLTNSPFGQKPKSGNFPSGFAGSGTKLFTSPYSADRDESTTEDDHEGPHFEPIIPLPEKIDVKTGEEDEEVMFSHRAKLYRFVGEDKHWKERGVGDIKLLKNRQSGKLRVLMRRDQVLKVCANHQITAEMKLQPNTGSDRSWVWSTMADFSEGECRAEQLAVRFKSEETAKQFKEKFEECQKMLKNPTAVKPQLKPKTIDGKEDLVSKFKPAEGGWECTICMVINASDKVECAACGSTKPGAEPSQGQKKEAKSSFLFGSGASSSGGGFTFGFGVSSQESDTKPVFTFGSSNQTSSPSSGFSFTFGSSKQGEPVSEQ